MRDREEKGELPVNLTVLLEPGMETMAASVPPIPPGIKKSAAPAR